ncbi:MAG: hypothetical protein SFY80_15090 [Verrucomicrobiota bacterium]|nr:hypothetical protein [Verrucomicrobiota bacterium]
MPKLLDAMHPLMEVKEFTSVLFPAIPYQRKHLTALILRKSGTGILPVCLPAIITEPDMGETPMPHPYHARFHAHATHEPSALFPRRNDFEMHRMRDTSDTRNY